jgi:replication factor C subunit 3/5
MTADTPMHDARQGVPFSEKYRPQSLSDVASHKEIISTISKLLDSNQLPHLLFYGPPGTGKTSTILAMAKQMYGKQVDAMTLELNASDDRGISIVRNEIQEFASTRTLSSNKHKLIILDECDAMTKDAQMALRRTSLWPTGARAPFCFTRSFARSFARSLTRHRSPSPPLPGVMEKYVKNARFCLICNYVSKIIPALQSRCTRFRFMPLPTEFVKERIEYVCGNEGIPTGSSEQEGGVSAVITLGQGDMRRTLNLLQSVAMGHANALSEENVYATAGKPRPVDVEEIVRCLMNEELSVAFERIKELTAHKGIALVDVLHELHELVFQIAMSAKARMELVSALAEIEWNLMGGSGQEVLQLGAVVGAFAMARQSMVAEAV